MCKIKPRVDDEGVGWCDAGCPAAAGIRTHAGNLKDVICTLGGIIRISPGGFCKEEDSEICPHHAARMAALLRKWEALAPEEGAWWCPACGETDCRHNGSCDGCGLPIEDSQPDFDLISATRALLNETGGE